MITSNSTKGSVKYRPPSAPCLQPQLPPQKQPLSPPMQLSGVLYANEFPYTPGTTALHPACPLDICLEGSSIQCVHIDSVLLTPGVVCTGHARGMLCSGVGQSCAPALVPS